MTTKEKFIEMAKNITRPGIDEMMAWLETTDFYVAPASTKFHGAQAGGLCAHSITVAKRLVWWRWQTSMRPASTAWMCS